MEDPLADEVYMRAHQRRANYDIWQDDQLLLKFAVHYLEDFDARLERFRSKLVVPRVSTGWYETSVKRMVEIRARAVAILAHQKSRVVVGGCCKVGGSGSSSVRQSVAGATATATATEDCDESACEEEEEEEEEKEGEEEEWEDSGEEDDTDEESEDDDSNDSDYDF